MAGVFLRVAAKAPPTFLNPRLMSIRKKLKSVNALFNYSTSVSINNRNFSVPIISNLGLANRKLGDNWFLHLLKAIDLPRNASFVDIGANVGQTLLVFRSCSDNPYWGFEPNPNCVFYLSVLVRKNKLKNANILPVGVSDSNTVGSFYSKGDADAAATTVDSLRPDHYEPGDVSYVPLFRFDELRIKGLSDIGLIKIDVEGGELEVVSGMVDTIGKHRPLIICEVLDYHSDKSKGPMQERADKLSGIFRQAGYDMFRIIAKDGTPALEPIQELQLKPWTPESHYLNDYLFAPQEYKIEEKITEGRMALTLKK